MKILSASGAMAAPILLAASVQAAPVAFFTTLQYEMQTCNGGLACVEGETYDVLFSGTVNINDPLQDQNVVTQDVMSASLSWSRSCQRRPS